MLTGYTIRESSRAKYVQFRVSMTDGLVVIVPRGFDQDRIPALLTQERMWLESAWQAMEQQRALQPDPQCRPSVMDLPALGRTWSVSWIKTSSTRVTVRERQGSILHVAGSIGDSMAWRAALKRWLTLRAREGLVPWVHELSPRLGVRPLRVDIRCQRSRWGSYSTRGTMSLNLQLLFLPPALAKYVLHHELCHILHPNHSPGFWRTLESVEPDTQRLRAQLREAWTCVPTWLTFVQDRPASEAAPETDE